MAMRPEEEGRAAIGRPQLDHPAELTQGLLQHPGLVEGDPQVPVLIHPALVDLGSDRGGGPDPVREAGGDQPEERLPTSNSTSPALLHHWRTSRVPSSRGSSAPAPARARAPTRRCAAIDRKDQVERRDLLLDQAPFVDPAGAFEEEVLGVDPHQEILALRADARFEVEGPRGPGEQVVHRLLDLDPDVVLELGPRDRALLTRISPSFCSRSSPCRFTACCSCPAEIRPLRSRMSPSRSRRFTIEAKMMLPSSK